ncbi:MAG: DUF5685 family protein [Lachnospiraceae bacterium]|nr:DUF5685 family protein [Lachnospiraceae bacterium]
MFGYIIADRSELKFKEYDIYRAYYCGLCKRLREHYGFKGQLTLSYDMTFVVMLLSSLYEPEDESSLRRCIAHPFEKHPTLSNSFTDYACDMNILLTYFKCLDDWEDEKKVSRYLFGNALKACVREIEKRYEEKAGLIKDRLSKISECEKNREASIDIPSGAFGDIMAEIFCYKHDEWERDLREMGFYLGKFIYIMDAYEDIERDEKTGNYNPIIIRNDIKKNDSSGVIKDENSDGYDDDLMEDTESILLMMMGECSKAFERLPIVNNIEILRNILYSGVWCRYNMIKKKRAEQDEKTV